VEVLSEKVAELTKPSRAEAKTKWRNRVLTLTCCALVALGTLCLLRSDLKSTPLYHGKPQKYWINCVGYRGAEPGMFDFDSNAIPLLLIAVNIRETPGRKFERFIWRKAPRFVQDRLIYPAYADLIHTNAAIILSGLADANTLADVFRQNPDPIVRIHAINGLTGNLEDTATRSLIEGMSDASAEVRAAAALGLASTERAKVVSAVPAILRNIHDPDPDARKFALWALANYADLTKETVPELKKALNDPDEGVRRLVARLLDGN